jgi:hypothetical protein
MDHKQFIDSIARYCIESANDIISDMGNDLGPDGNDVNVQAHTVLNHILPEEVGEAIDILLRVPLDELTFEQIAESHDRCFTPCLQSAYFSRRADPDDKDSAAIYVCLFEDETTCTGFAAAELMLFYNSRSGKLDCDYVQCMHGEILERE